MTHRVLEQKLSFSQKLSRLKDRMSDPQWRRYAKLLVAGKFLGLALVLGLMVAMSAIPQLLNGTPVFAQQAATQPAQAYPGLDATSIVNPLNTVWTLVAAFLVFGMQVGQLEMLRLHEHALVPVDPLLVVHGLQFPIF